MIRSALILAPILTALPLSLAACDSKGDGTSITLNATDSDGNVLGAIDGKTGEMKFDVPGFKGAIKLPKVKLNAGNFDLNGVHLYPGSTIAGMNIAGGEGDSNGNGGAVRVTFDTPAAAGTVRDWFAERLTKAGYTIKTEGNALVGSTEEKQPFRLDLTPNGADAAKGTIVIGS